MDDHRRTDRWERLVGLPLALGSLVYLACYALLVLGQDVSEDWRLLWLTVLLATWAAFLVDYAVRWRLSGEGLRFVRTHGLDTLVVVLPLLRPLRVVQLYEVVQRRQGRPRLALYSRVMAYAGVSTVLLGFSGSLAVYSQERGAPHATIKTFGDSAWWTCATLATVGYGDVAPVTPSGRVIAVGLMICGLALLGAVTGSFSSWLLKVFAHQDEAQPPGS